MTIDEKIGTIIYVSNAIKLTEFCHWFRNFAIISFISKLKDGKPNSKEALVK